MSLILVALLSACTPHVCEPCPPAVPVIEDAPADVVVPAPALSPDAPTAPADPTPLAATPEP